MPRNEKQFLPSLLRFDQLRADAAEVVRLATTRHVKRYDLPGALHHTAISRARCGHPSNPVYRLALLLFAMRQAGDSREHAELIIAHLSACVHELWADALPRMDVAILAEAEADTQEDILQARLLVEGGCPEYVRALERQIATSQTLLAVSRRTGAHRWLSSHAHQFARIP